MFGRTLREDPAEAEVASHRLLVRAGYIRRAASGCYTLLPLGKLVVDRIADVIHEEMGLIGRSSSDLDGRAAMVDLTEIGKRAVSDLRKARRRLFAELLDDFDDEDLERFESYLGRLFKGFEASIATGARA